MTDTDQELVKVKKTRTFTRVPLADIVIDPAWNTRSPGWLLASGGPDDEGGIEELMLSIERDGQDNPVIVRPNGAAQSSGDFGMGKPYVLVAGFRRAEAIRRLAEKRKDAEPTILAFVRAMSETEARVANLRENTARESLSPADLAHGIHALLDEGNMRGEDVAQKLGLSKEYVLRLAFIMKKVRASVTKAWRESTVNVLTTAEMHELCSVPKDEQEAEFRRMVASRTGEVKKGGNRNWVDGAQKKIEHAAKILGALERAGMCTVSVDWEDREVYPLLGVKRQLTERQVQAFARVADRAYHSALGTDAEESAEEGEGVTQ